MIEAFRGDLIQNEGIQAAHDDSNKPNDVTVISTDEEMVEEDKVTRALGQSGPRNTVQPKAGQWLEEAKKNEPLCQGPARKGG